MNVHEVVLPDMNNNLKMRAWALHVIIEEIRYHMCHYGGITRLKAAPGVKKRFVSTLRTECEFLCSTNNPRDVWTQSRDILRDIEGFEQELKPKK